MDNNITKNDYVPLPSWMMTLYVMWWVKKTLTLKYDVNISQANIDSAQNEKHSVPWWVILC